nr:MAG TPA: hypothetical protein [Caudoviricetes sp.]
MFFVPACEYRGWGRGKRGVWGELGVRVGIASFSNRQRHRLGRYRSKRQVLKRQRTRQVVHGLPLLRSGKGPFWNSEF